jgi:hypothetical protein
MVGGLIGETRIAYDYWGETMIIASRIEGPAEPGGIAVSERMCLRTRGKELFDLPMLATLKGLREAPIYRFRKLGARRGLDAGNHIMPNSRMSWVIRVSADASSARVPSAAFSFFSRVLTRLVACLSDFTLSPVGSRRPAIKRSVALSCASRATR